MKKIYFLFLILFLCCGCLSFGSVSKLKILKSLANEQTETYEYLQEQDEKFELLLEIIKSDEIENYCSNKKTLISHFGDPVLTKDEEREGEKVELLLYRYATEYFYSDKVYLYYNLSGDLVDWEYVEKKSKQ